MFEQVKRLLICHGVRKAVMMIWVGSIFVSEFSYAGCAENEFEKCQFIVR
ncbi:MAG: hypothetical protein ACU84Q_11440 [Gammaproteobacteria bacterium]